MPRRSTSSLLALPQWSKLALVLVFVLSCAATLPVSTTRVQASALPAQSATAQTLPALLEVKMRTPTDGWIVGANGVTLRWNGTQWRPVATPHHVQTIYDVSILSATDAWAVAAEYDHSVVLRWNGTSWLPIGLPQYSNQLQTITMVSPTQGWVGGWERAYAWDGVSWTADTWLFEGFSSTALSPTDVWMGGRPLKRWNGSQWIDYDNKGITASGMMFSSPTDGWIVGNIITFCYMDNCTYEAISGHWDGNSWARVPVPNTTPYSLADVWSSTTSGTWAVGGINNKGFILRWNGTSWINVPLPAEVGYLSGIAMVSATDGWAVSGNGEILRWNGTQWNLWTYSIEQTYIPMSVGG